MNSKKPISNSITKYNSKNASSLAPHLPTDEQAERAMIASILAMPSLLSDVSITLSAGEVFTHEGYKLIFSAMVGLWNAGKPLKVATILQTLKKQGGFERLLEMGVSLTDLPVEGHASDAQETALYLRELWVKRQATESAMTLLGAVQSGRPVDELADLLSQAGESVSAGLNLGSDPTLGSLITASLKSIDQAVSQPGSLTGVETGLRKLNRHFGGWQATDVVVIAGRPGAGKTVAGLFHAEAAAKAGIPVAYLSLEMPAKSLIYRMMSARCGVSYSDMKKGDVTRDQMQAIHRAAGELERLPIHFYDGANQDVNDLIYKLVYWKKRFNIGLVVIDYVGLLTDRTVHGGKEYDVITEVSKKLKSLQKRLDCPIIELCQLSRAVEGRGNKRPNLSDLRNTGQLEQDASVVVMLYRDDYYKEQNAREDAEKSGQPYMEPVFDHQLEYGIVKNRDGFTGVARFWCDVATNRIADEATAGQPASYFPATDPGNWYNPVSQVSF